jgi:hypothetical protein
MAIPFTVNGTSLITRPEEHGWVDRPILGYDGSAHPVYPYSREYELNWSFLDPDTFQQLVGFYNLTSTGTTVVGLPGYGVTIDPDNFDNCFKNYTGCVVGEPQYKGFSNGYYKSVKLLVVGIRT